jgi:hypothetical protein
MKDKVTYNMSFSQRELAYIKELEKSKNKNNVNEMIINQLKKELEKYAFKLIKMQELSLGESIRDEIEKEIKGLECTMSGSRIINEEEYGEETD